MLALSSPAAAQAPLSLDQHRAALATALKKGTAEDYAAHARAIAERAGALPDWVAQKQQEASAVPEAKMRAVQMWQKIRQAALSATDMETALMRAAQALTVARDNLGEAHMATIASTADLARLNGAAGKYDEAEAGYGAALDIAGKALGAGHPETLALQSSLAELQAAQARYDQAVETRAAAVKSAEAALGADHPITLEARLALALAQANAGRHAEAEKVVESACAALRRTHGLHPQLARCLTQFAALGRERGDLAPAQKAIDEARKILTLAVPPANPAALSMRLETARIAARQGDTATARSSLEGVLKDAGEDGATILAAKAELVDVLDQMGEYAAAEVVAREVLAEQERRLGDSHPATLTTLSSLGAVLRKQGRLREAEQAFQNAHDRFLAVLGSDHYFSVIAAGNLGEILEKAGLYDRAEPYLRAAVEGARAGLGESHPTTIIGINNLALLHESQGEFDKAEALYGQALDLHAKLLGANHPDTIAFANNLAYLHMLKQDYASAEAGFAKVVKAWTKLLGADHQNTLKAMNSQGRVAHALGRLDEAEALLTRSLERRRATLGARHLDTLRSMHDLAALHHSAKRSEQARQLLVETRALAEEVLGRLHPYTFEAMNTLARVVEDSGDLQAAYEIRHETVKRRTDFLNTMLYVTGENAREAYIRLHAPELAAHVALLTKLDPEVAGRGVLEVSLNRKGLLLKVASEIQQIARLAQSPELADLAKELNEARKSMAALTLAGPTVETAATHLETIALLEERISVLQGELGRASMRYRRAAAPIPVDDLVAALPDDAVLVDFILADTPTGKQLVAATLSKQDGKPVFGIVPYADNAAIDDVILKYRADIQDEELDFDDVLETGQEAYDLVWRPLLDAIGDRTKVYVVPDGGLNILPFSALVDDDGKYLIENTDLHIFTSGRTLLPSALPKPKGGYLINAGPDYDTEEVTGTEQLERVRSRSVATPALESLRGMSSGMRGLKFDPLPGAEREGRLIDEMVDSSGLTSTIFVKDEAQEATLRNLAEPPEVLHIATHGFFLKADEGLRKRLLKLQRGADIQIPPPGDNPLLRAGLAFAGINANAPLLGEIDTDNDGVLTALEVLSLDLTGTQLVILSACETGLGEIHEGEGVYGLRRSFQEAGAGSVITSLWEVSDAGTQAMMTALYTRLMAGTEPHQAMRDAQLEMLSTGRWSAPFIWSAFFMVDG